MICILYTLIYMLKNDQNIPNVSICCQNRFHASHSHLLQVMAVMVNFDKSKIKHVHSNSLPTHCTYASGSMCLPDNPELNTVNPAILLWQNNGFPYSFGSCCSIKAEISQEIEGIWWNRWGFDHSFTETRLPSVELGWVMPLTVVLQLKLPAWVDRI